MKDGSTVQNKRGCALTPQQKQERLGHDLAMNCALDPDKLKLENLQEMASAQEIPLQKIVPSAEPGWLQKTVPSMKPGWAGKQRGLHRALREQGRIDASCLDDCAIAKKDNLGAVVEELILRHCIVESCLDFANEASCKRWERKWESE